jgi:CSLREA domain-containing protein
LAILVGIGLVWITLFAARIPQAQAKAEGVIITVTDYSDDNIVNANCTLREAIHAANTDTAVDNCVQGDGHDTIELQAGTYEIKIGGTDEDLNFTGDLDILTDSLTIEGADNNTTFINANQIDRVLDIHGVDVDLSGLTVQYGKAPDDIYWNGGGGILNRNGHLTLTNVTVYSNTSGINTTGGNGGTGGGIFNTGYLTLIKSSVEENTTGSGDNGGNGGGIANVGTLILVSSVVQANQAGQGEWGGDGGGIYSNGYLSVTNSDILSNMAGSGEGGISGGYGGNGGGIHIVNFPAYIQGSAIYENRAGASKAGGTFGNGGLGGGILHAAGGTLEITDSTIADNFGGEASASNGTGGSGGGIYSNVPTELVDSIVWGNQGGGAKLSRGGSGAGIFSEGPLTIRESTIAHNLTGQGEYLGSPLAGSGGGIWSNDDLEISGSSIFSNTTQEGGEGGGLYVTSQYSRTLAITNTTISANYAGSGGGGMYINTVNDDISATLKFVTMDSNTADGGGNSLYVGVVNKALALHINHTILASAGDNYQFYNIGGTLSLDRDYTLSNDNSLSVTGTGNLNNSIPLLGPLQDNGGPTWTQALLPGSPAFNAGDPTYTPPPDNDQRGFGYPRVSLGMVDIGAFEFDLEMKLYLPLVIR